MFYWINYQLTADDPVEQEESESDDKKVQVEGTEPEALGKQSIRSQKPLKQKKNKNKKKPANPNISDEDLDALLNEMFKLS